MGRTFVIAEAGSSHDNDYGKALRLIEAAKSCGADACKFQWTSDGNKMSLRRGLKVGAENMYSKWLEKPVSWLESLKAHCDSVGIEFMCTVYLIEDIAVIAPLVKYFKISAFESQWREFVSAHCRFEKPLFMSVNLGMKRLPFCQDTNFLYCVSKYPTPLYEMSLRWMQPHDGLSDHSGCVLAGAMAVARGAPVVEAHIRLHDTDSANPDFGHSLCCDEPVPTFRGYVGNIRIAERML